jgi:hypothetical protein
LLELLLDLGLQVVELVDAVFGCGYVGEGGGEGVGAWVPAVEGVEG